MEWEIHNWIYPELSVTNKPGKIFILTLMFDMMPIPGPAFNCIIGSYPYNKYYL